MMPLRTNAKSHAAMRPCFCTVLRCSSPRAAEAAAMDCRKSTPAGSLIMLDSPRAASHGRFCATKMSITGAQDCGGSQTHTSKPALAMRRALYLTRSRIPAGCCPTHSSRLPPPAGLPTSPGPPTQGLQDTEHARILAPVAQARHIEYTAAIDRLPQRQQCGL